MSTHIQLKFGKTTLKAAAPADLNQLRTTIKAQIPALEPHLSVLEFRYVDDEGDEIVVTTDDELEEAVRLLTETPTLRLEISVPAGQPSPVVKKSSFIDAMDTATAPKKTLKSGNPSPALTDTADVLMSIRKAGEQALSQLNAGLDIARAEITRLNVNLNEAHEVNTRTSEELETVRTELSVTKRTNAESQALLTSQVAALEVKLANIEHDLATERDEKSKCQAKLSELMLHAAEASQWKAKFLAAEQEREQFKTQLHTLRTGLFRLTESKSDLNSNSVDVAEATESQSPLVAEVLSMEPVGDKPEDLNRCIDYPLVDSTRPASPPPEYPSSVQISTVSETACPIPPVRSPKTAPSSQFEFPIDCPAPSDAELKLQQMRDMGFEISLDDLNRKLQEFNGDMTNVINSLL